MSIRKITKIEVQKRNRRRNSLFLDGEFFCGISRELVEELGLYEEAEIDDSYLAKIVDAEEKYQVYSKAIDLISRRDHSEFELRRKLKQREFRSDLIEDAITKLKENRLLNDEKFAESYVGQQVRLKPMGRRRVKYELRHRGVNDTISEKIIDKVFEEEEVDEYEMAAQLARKKLGQMKDKDSESKKRKIAGFLGRRGFNNDVVYKVIGELFY